MNLTTHYDVFRITRTLIGNNPIRVKVAGNFDSLTEAKQIMIALREQDPAGKFVIVRTTKIEYSDADLCLKENE